MERGRKESFKKLPLLPCQRLPLVYFVLRRFGAISAVIYIGVLPAYIMGASTRGSLRLLAHPALERQI